VITDERAQEAFHWLNDHTDEIGEAKGEQERSKILMKRVRQRFFLKFEGSVAAREAAADIEPEVEAADERYCAAVANFAKLTAKQELESIALDVWRTESANRRRN
jgi:hypothetical protein